MIFTSLLTFRVMFSSAPHVLMSSLSVYCSSLLSPFDDLNFRSKLLHGCFQCVDINRYLECVSSCIFLVRPISYYMHHEICSLYSELQDYQPVYGIVQIDRKQVYFVLAS